MRAPLKHILALAILLPSFMYAQRAPGYLGKTFSIQYDALMFPSFFNPNSADAQTISEDDFRQKGVSLNYKHSFVGQWSFSKRSSLIASVGFVNTNYIPQAYSYSGFSGNEILFNQYPGMSATSFDAGLRIFTQHYAPLGKFIEFRLGMATVKTDDFTYYALNNFTTPSTVSIHTVEGRSMTRPTISVAFGTNRVIKNVILLSYGVDVSLFTGGIGRHIGLRSDDTNSEFRDFEEGNSDRNQEELLKMAAARYGIQTAINLKIGVGLLL